MLRVVQHQPARTMKRRLTLSEVDVMAAAQGEAISVAFGKSQIGGLNAYAVPRGGIPAAYAIQRFVPVVLVNHPEEADLYIDDIVDSGRTRRELQELNDVPFFALVDKTKMSSLVGTWIEFPWESSLETDMTTTITRLLQQIGEDPKREGLEDTPMRVARAWGDWCRGYKATDEDVAIVLKVFEDGSEEYDEMVVVRNIPFYSHCEHHMAPFFGTADIGYVPSGKIVGLSKLSRLLDIFAHRLQVQERLTQQVAQAMMTHLLPKGVGVSITARHLCMESRGIHKQGSETVTTALYGVFKQPEVRAEFLR